MHQQKCRKAEERSEPAAVGHGRQDHAAGERWIDPEREAELVQALVEENAGPLSERGVRSIFSAVLDVLKQEVVADRGSRAAATPDTSGAAIRASSGRQPISARCNSRR